MTYLRWLILAIVMAFAVFAGCSPGERPFETSSGSSSSSSSTSSSSGGTDPVCNDGVKEGAEQCDGTEFGDATCASIMGTGYFLPAGKTFVCKNDCTIDTSTCTNACILDDPGSQLDSCVLQ